MFCPMRGICEVVVDTLVDSLQSTLDWTETSNGENWHFVGRSDTSNLNMLTLFID